ncbi:MAG: response regulator transcription factor [Bacteroidota bacterium]
MYQIKILIVEDDIFIAQDIKECLVSHDYHVTEIAYQFDDALACLAQELPDLVLLDINLGEGPDGVSLAKLLQARYQIPFVYLTSYADRATLERVKPTRPLAYIVKPFTEKDLFANIELAMYKYAERYQPPTWQADYINQKLSTDFTPKEVEVLQGIFAGKTNRQLCEQHFISTNTIKTHVRRIYSKLQVNSRPEAMAFLRQSL